MICTPKRMSVYIKTTDRCQMNCRHCYTPDKLPASLDFDPAKTFDFIEGMMEKFPIEQIDYSFHGGEPMMCELKKMQYFIALNSYNKRLFGKTSFSMQTNLVYKLNDKKIEFLRKLDILGTSWDYDLRFNRDGQKELWEHNVGIINNLREDTHVTVSLSRELIRNKEPIEVIDRMIELGFTSILFERLTRSGNALENTDIFPSSIELNDWLSKMWKQSKLNNTYKSIHNLFLEPTIKMILNGDPLPGQRRCRSCEQSVLTINPNGTIGGCPDGASSHTFGNISLPAKDVLFSPDRFKVLSKEAEVQTECAQCELYNICRGDCYHQQWDEFGCMAPREMMREMLKEDKKVLTNYLSIQ